jgi:two-component system, response regulator
VTEHRGLSLRRLAGVVIAAFGNTVAQLYRWDGICVDTRTILLVEDNPEDEALLRRALQKTGITNPIVTAKDGLEAIHYLFARGKYEFRDSSVVPVVVLIDLNLPKIDGLEVLRRMRADYRTKLIPVAIFTSSVEEQDLINGYSLGANSYVRKPVKFTEFSKVVEQLVTYWVKLNEPPPPGEKTWAHHFNRAG